MKKRLKLRIILLPSLLICLIHTSAWGQVEYGKYQLKVSTTSLENYKNNLCKANFIIYSVKNGTETILLNWEIGGIDGGHTTPGKNIERIYTIESNTQPDAIKFWANRGYTKFLQGCGYHGSNGGDTHKLNHSKPFLEDKFTKGDTNNDLFTMFNTTATILFHPYEIKIWYYNNNSFSQGQLLPMNDKITLKATKGFVATTYNWQYCTDGYSWKDFPSSMQNRDEITFSGRDLFSQEEYLSLIKKNGNNVQVRINAVTEKGSQSIVLTPNIESPHFVSHTYEPEKCNGSGDATLYLTMDRALYTGEIIYIAFDDQVSQSNPTLQLDGTNTGELIGLSSKAHNLHVWGSVNGYESYAKAPEHYRVVTIDPRPAITHSLTGTKNISCIGGADGTISVKASGGTGQFRGNLYLNNPNEIIKQVDFVTGGVGTFTGLKAGTYNISIFDSNGCNNKQKPIQTATLTEPTQAIDATLEQAKKPLAYDSSDGEATIRIKGGTHNNVGYTIQMTSEGGQTYAPQSSSRDGNSFLYTFKGLHRGKHDVTVEDQNYPGLLPEDKQSPCGCTSTMTFYLNAPPPLEVSIEETHFVNCYGSDEGELTAHAKGGVRLTGMPYTYTWYRLTESTPQELTQPNDSVIGNLTAGNYQVKITDANLISITSAPFTLVQPEPLAIEFETDRVGCIDQTKGRAKAIVSGGTPPYKYQWLGLTSTESETTVPEAGRYTVKVTDERNCQLIASTEVIASVEVMLESVVLPLAYDSSDGEATVRVKGGVQMSGGYTTQFRSESGQTYSPKSSVQDGDSFLYTFKGLHRGEHFITVGDKIYANPVPGEQVLCGSSDQMQFHLDAPPPQEIRIDETHFVNCYGSNEGELTAHAKGGVPFAGSIMPYTYTWYRLSERGTQELNDLPNDSVARGLIAGTYQVKMTDANRISMLSAPFLLVQPDSLSLVFETGDIGCSGASTGIIKATVSGGTPPYKYQWNKEGETNSQLSALEAGIYMIRVTDQRNCQLVATTEVTAPGGLKVDSLITHPSCIAPEGGSIELKLTGATPPYKVTWADNKSTELIRKGLSPGTYYAAISDVNGCSSSFSFTLNKPREFNVKLSDGFTMCHGQSRPITVKCDEPEVKYEWYCNDTKLSGTDSTLVADKAGIYRVVATNPQGCTAEDEVTISISQEALDLELAMPTAVAAGSEIHAVNLSTVTADRIKWNFPKEAQIIKQSDTEAVFSIREKGAYFFSMEGFKGDCSTIVNRTIHVMDKDEVTLPDDQPPLIKQFLVTPNPTTGYFKVMVELNSEEDFTMMLYSPAGVLMDKKEAVKVKNKTFEYEVNGTLQGTYLLHLQTKADKSVLQIVIKRD